MYQAGIFGDMARRTQHVAKHCFPISQRDRTARILVAVRISARLWEQKSYHVWRGMIDEYSFYNRTHSWRFFNTFIKTMCVFFTWTFFLCTRRHPEHPVSVLILHPIRGDTTLDFASTGGLEKNFVAITTYKIPVHDTEIYYSLFFFVFF